MPKVVGIIIVKYNSEGCTKMGTIDIYEHTNTIHILNKHVFTVHINESGNLILERTEKTKVAIDNINKARDDTVNIIKKRLYDIISMKKEIADSLESLQGIGSDCEDKIIGDIKYKCDIIKNHKINLNNHITSTGEIVSKFMYDDEIKNIKLVLQPSVCVYYDKMTLTWVRYVKYDKKSNNNKRPLTEHITTRRTLGKCILHGSGTSRILKELKINDSVKKI